MTAFEAGERGWINRFGKLRNVVRQELIARQLATSLGQPGSVLDVGCGQGEQARRLLAAGWTVTGVDPSEELLQSFRSACSGDATTVELIAGDIEELNSLLGRRSFDLVCAHGLLMYLDDRGWAVQTLAHRVAPGGVLSLTFRNAHALAMRPGVRQDWRGALQAFDSSSYINELGLDARADRLDDIDTDLVSAGLSRTAWFGVRLFTDALDPDTPVPADPGELAALLDAEERAGRLDPYRWLAPQIHVIASRPVT